MSELNRVLVFGATGAQGGPVVRHLMSAGVAVRAVSRDPEKVSKVYGERVETAEADLSDADSLRAAFAGVDAAFLHLPIPRDARELREAPTRLGNVLRAAKHADLSRLVFTTSGTTTEMMPPIALVEGNRAAARAVLASGVPSVVLRPTIYLENLLQPHTLAEMREQGTLSYPPLDSTRKVSWTGLEDQAALAVAAMRAEGVTEKQFDISSPEPVTGDELAAMLSEKQGRTVRYTPVSPQQFGAGVARFYGEEAGHGIAELYDATNRLPPDGAVINLEPVLSALGVTLTPVSQWIARQAWDRIE